MTNPAAWHPDPTGTHEYRWWDGSRWTEHVADGGQASVDPLPGGPGSAEADSETTDAEGSRAASSEGSSAAGRSSTQEPTEQGAGGWQQPDQTRQQPADQGAGGGGQQPPSWQQTPAWSQPGGQQSTDSDTNGVAIAALIVGILSLLIAWIPFLGLLGGLGGVVAVVLGFIGNKRAKSPTTGGGGAAITGIVTGVLALILTIVVHVAIFAFGSSFIGGTVESYEQCLEAGGTEAECQEELERDIMRRFGQ